VPSSRAAIDVVVVLLLLLVVVVVGGGVYVCVGGELDATRLPLVHSIHRLDCTGVAFNEVEASRRDILSSL